MNKSTIAIALVALLSTWPVASAHAQTTANPATAASPAKKALIARVIKLQQPGIEGLGRAMAERPAINLMDTASIALQERVPADKRDAVGKAIQADAKKYLDEVVPLVVARATQLAPATLSPFLEDKFTDDELKQVASFLESAAVIKYQKLSIDMQKLLQEKVLADTKSVVEPKVGALEDAIAKRVEAAAAAK